MLHQGFGLVGLTYGGAPVISALSCPGKNLPQFKSAEKLLNYYYCCLLLEGFHQNFLDEQLLLEELSYLSQFISNSPHNT
jgi:hypothetical protein